MSDCGCGCNEVGAFSMCKPRLLAVIVTVQRPRTCDPELTCRQLYATIEDPKPVLTEDSDPIFYNSPAPPKRLKKTRLEWGWEKNPP
jgi:hypothetical protein